MRLIDAKKHKESVERWQRILAKTYGKNDEYVVCIESVLDLLEDAPTVDAVSVVRCKDCVSYGTSIAGVPCQGYCKQLEYTTRKDDDFCSWGRRKNEAD